MASLKRVISNLAIILFVMLGSSCSYDNPCDLEENADKDCDKDGIKNRDDKTPTKAEFEPDDGTASIATNVAFKYGEELELTDVQAVSSAIKFGNAFYFIGASNDVRVLGRFDKNDQITLTAFASLSDGPITLDNSIGTNYYLPSNQDKDGNLHIISGSGKLYEIDTDNLKAVSSFQLEGLTVGGGGYVDCNLYFYENRWHWLSGTVHKVFGASDGSSIENGNIKDPFTKEIMSFGEQLIFDGQYFYNYKASEYAEGSGITQYTSGFESVRKISTSAYKYNKTGSRFISNGSADKYWFFGCADSKCFRTDVTTVSQ